MRDLNRFALGFLFAVLLCLMACTAAQRRDVERYTSCIVRNLPPVFIDCAKLNTTIQDLKKEAFPR